MRIAIAVFSSVLVLACSGIEQDAPNRVQVEVSGEVVKLALPDAFCFDQRSSDRNSNGAFFLAVTCDPAPGKQNVAITTSVSNDALNGSLVELEEFLRGDGVALLGKSAEPENISVLATQTHADALFLKIRDTGNQPVPDAPEEFWRAFFEAGNRMIGLSVVGIADTRLTDAQAVAILGEVVALTAASNTGESK